MAEKKIYTDNVGGGELPEDMLCGGVSDEATVDREAKLQPYKLLFDSANIGMEILDVQGRIVLANKFFASMHGFTEDEVKGCHFSEFLSPAERKGLDELHSKILVAGSFKMTEIEHARKDGEIFPAMSNGALIKGENGGDVRGAVVTVQDITELKMARMQAEEKENKLLRADKMLSLGLLVSGVAHEINNPNNSIMLNMPIIRNLIDYALPMLDAKFKKEGDFKIGKIPYSVLRNELDTLFAGINESSVRIKNIVADLKEYARDVSADKFTEVNMNEVVNSSLGLLKVLVRKSVSELICRLEEDLPRIQGAFQRLEQVVVNLIQNACESGGGKKIKLEIHTGFDKSSGRVFVSIEDNGVGISGNSVQYIYDPFYTTKRSGGGMGLGLSVSSGIVREHEGEIIINSKPGRGTLFKVMLPLAGKV